MMPPM